MEVLLKFSITMAFLLVCLAQSVKAGNGSDYVLQSSQCIQDTHFVIVRESQSEPATALRLVNCTIKLEIEFSNGTTITGTVTIYSISLIQCVALKTLSWLD